MRRLWLVLAAVTVSLLAGCGTEAGTPPSSASAGQFNKTDVMFAQMMLAHQAPSAEMLLLAQQRAASTELKTLVAAIAATEADEAKLMRDWLRQWGQPTASADDSAHAAHGGLPSTGEAEIESLRNAAEADFDRMFLNLFIGRQNYAVQLAEMEVGHGANPDARALAERVDQSRTAEIEMMQKMLA